MFIEPDPTVPTSVTVYSLEPQRRSLPFQAAIAIAAAAAVAAAVQRVAQAPAPGALPVPAGAPVVPAGPAPNAQFAANMATIKARLLAYLVSPGVTTKVPYPHYYSNLDLLYLRITV